MIIYDGFVDPNVLVSIGPGRSEAKSGKRLTDDDSQKLSIVRRVKGYTKDRTEVD